MAQSIRDQIRSATLGKKTQFKSKVFEWEGISVEFRQPNLRQRKNLLKKAKDKNGEFDIIEFIVNSVIQCTYIPDTTDNVFEDEDYESLMQQGSGSFVEVFGAEISELMNAGDEEGDSKKP